MKTPRHFAPANGKEQDKQRLNPTPGGSEERAMPEKNEELDPVDESDITDEDIEALGPVDLSMDMGDDEDLKHREYPVDFAGSDLDVPGAELDDDNENNGSEDEENNHYSIGGDNAI